MTRYHFIDTERVNYPLGVLCRVMWVSPGAYHAYARGKSHAPSAKKAALGERVKEVFDRHRRRYGSRRVAAELKAERVSAGRFAVRAQMRRLGLQAIGPRRFRAQTTDSRHSAQASAEPFTGGGERATEAGRGEKSATSHTCRRAAGGGVTWLRGRINSANRLSAGRLRIQ